MQHIQVLLNELHDFFSGMTSIDRSGALSPVLKLEFTQMDSPCTKRTSGESFMKNIFTSPRTEKSSCWEPDQVLMIETLKISNEVSHKVKDMILKIDREDRGDQEDLHISTVAWAFEDHHPHQFRVLLVCLDNLITADKKAVKLFQDSVNAGVPIIALLCPGYVLPKGPAGKQFPDYPCWWPGCMPEMKSHADFIDI